MAPLFDFAQAWRDDDFCKESQLSRPRPTLLDAYGSRKESDVRARRIVPSKSKRSVVIQLCFKCVQKPHPTSITVDIPLDEQL